jgi:hypothetical protein
MVPVEAGAAPVEAGGSAGAVRRTAAADLRHAAAAGSCGVGVAVGPAASPAVGGQARAPAGTQAIAHTTDHRHSFPEGTRSGNVQHTAVMARECRPALTEDAILLVCST